VFACRTAAAAVLLLETAGLSPASAATSVAPARYADAEASLALSTPISQAARTLQTVVAATSLGGIPVGAQIMGLSFRLDDSQSAWPVTAINWSSYSIQLSSSLFAPGSLSTNFAANIGPDVVTVRSGALAVQPFSYPADQVPNEFGSRITFSTPYTYRGGPLLVTIRHSGNGSSDHFVDAAPDLAGEFQTIYNPAGENATTATFKGRTPVFQVYYTVVPEPAGVLPLAMLGLGWLTVRRRNRARV